MEINQYYDIESERCIIAAMLASEESMIQACATMQTDDYYEPKHKAMFDILSGLYVKAIKPTFLEMLKEGVKLGTMASIEDREYAKQTIGFHVSTVSLPYWFKNVKDKSRLRALRSVLMNLSEELKSPAIDVDELINNASRNLAGLITTTTEQIDTGADLARIGREVIEDRMAHKGELQGISTGIRKLNRLTNGWKPGDLILLTAESGKGKTAFAQNFIAAGCFMHEVGTLYANSEMSKKQVIMRFASMVSGVDADRIKYGEITEEEKQGIFGNMEIIDKAPFYHYPCPSLNINKLVSMIRKLKVQKGIKLVVLDYIGRMDTAKDQKEWEALSSICKALKTIAQELEIAVIVLAQLTEEGALQAAKRMRNEADILIKLLPMTEDEKIESLSQGFRVKPDYFVFLDKNRDGQGEISIPVKFDKAKMQVIDVANI